MDVFSDSVLVGSNCQKWISVVELFIYNFLIEAFGVINIEVITEFTIKSLFFFSECCNFFSRRKDSPVCQPEKFLDIDFVVIHLLLFDAEFKKKKECICIL